MNGCINVQWTGVQGVCQAVTQCSWDSLLAHRSADQVTVFYSFLSTRNQDEFFFCGNHTGKDQAKLCWCVPLTSRHTALGWKGTLETSPGLDLLLLSHHCEQLHHSEQSVPYFSVLVAVLRLKQLRQACQSLVQTKSLRPYGPFKDEISSS